MNEYGVGRRLYHHGMYVSALTGFVAAVILYFGAPLFADGDANVIPVLRSLTLAILVIPSMSLVRGFFQGYQQMAPSAISQFVEQVFRVVYMLAATFLSCVCSMVVGLMQSHSQHLRLSLDLWAAFYCWRIIIYAIKNQWMNWWLKVITNWLYRLGL